MVDWTGNDNELNTFLVKITHMKDKTLREEHSNEPQPRISYFIIHNHHPTQCSCTSENVSKYINICN